MCLINQNKYKYLILRISFDQLIVWIKKIIVCVNSPVNGSGQTNAVVVTSVAVTGAKVLVVGAKVLVVGAKVLVVGAAVVGGGVTGQNAAENRSHRWLKKIRNYQCTVGQHIANIPCIAHQRESWSTII